MSRNFDFSPDARDDVYAIWEYYATEDSVKLADRIVARIYDECEKLAEHPGMGHYRHSLLDERYKFWCVWSYLIVYRWQSRPIRIVSVVHGARDLDGYFRYFREH